MADNGKEREKKLCYMSNQMDTYLTHYQNSTDPPNSKVRMAGGKRKGCYIVILYLFVKVLYFANVVGQIFMLESLLTDGIHGYAIDVMFSFVQKSGWPESVLFPRTTMCKFQLRTLGNQMHDHIVQCVLSINFFHEKAYIVIWLWFVFVACATGISLLYWLIRFIFRGDRVRYIKRHLRIMEKITSTNNKDDVYRFVEDYLRHDGVFAIRLVNLNISGMVAAQLVAELWHKFKYDKMGSEDEVKRPPVNFVTAGEKQPFMDLEEENQPVIEVNTEVKM